MSQNEPPGRPGGLDPPAGAAGPPTEAPTGDGPPATAPQPSWPDAAAGLPADGSSPVPPASAPGQPSGVPEAGAAEPPGTTPDGGWTPSGVFPPAGWEAGAAARPSGRSRLLPRLIIPVIIVVVLVGGFLLRDRLSSAAAELKPGDCFDDPITAGQGGGEIKDVQHHPCSEAHHFEVIQTFKFPSGGDAPFPGQGGFETFIVEKCKAAFTSYVGIPEDQSSMGFLAYSPVESGWKQGDREITCFLGAVDGSKLTGSMKNARR